MRKIIVSVPLATLMLAGTSTAFAATNHSVASIAPAIQAVNNSASIGFNDTLMNYQENITPEPSDTESGWMPGFQAKASFMHDIMGVSHVYLQLQTRYNSGGIRYHGAIGDTPVQTTDNATTFTIGGRIGKGFSLMDDQAMITPYVGMGYYHWNRHLEGAAGYKEDYSSGYASVGGLFQYAVSPRMLVGVSASYGMVFDGGLTASDFNPESDLAGATLKTKTFDITGRERIAANVDYLISNNLYAYGGLSYSHFNYSGAPIPSLPGSFEPSSQTNRFGINVGVGYSF
ncbi:hypothetical protein [Acidithiobacillus sp.]|uniref:hypothetical protein n=1 Tax=Acidithiobacillus sp. TaxID=1872118 RepID=UPI0032AE9645